MENTTNQSSPISDNDNKWTYAEYHNDKKADAALDAKREGRIIEGLHQAADHPISLNYPEGYYLKGLVCQMD